MFGSKVKEKLRSHLYHAALLIFGVCTPAFAKCPLAVLEVAGHVASSGPPSLVEVEVETPKGHFADIGEVDGRKFTVAVKFPTHSSYTPFFGHRCKNLPSIVVVTQRVNGKIVSQKKMNFRKDFEEIPSHPYRPYAYRPRREVLLGPTTTAGQTN